MNKSLKKIIATIIVAIIYSTNITVCAATDTLFIWSSSMHKTIPNAVIKPDNYAIQQHYPVVYFLHGYAGSFSNYTQKIKLLQQLVNQYQFIIVCPDGGFSSWYINSPVDSNYQYETYITKELIDSIDKHYSTIANAENRAISGLSMGGFGAYYLAIKHTELFGACGSMSGAFNVSVIQNKYDVDKRFGNYTEHKKLFESSSIHNLIADSLHKAKQLHFFFDCGTDDFIYGMSLQLHKKMSELNISHTYLESSGKHDWTYWNRAFAYQCLFFNNYFKKVE